MDLDIKMKIIISLIFTNLIFLLISVYLYLDDNQEKVNLISNSNIIVHIDGEVQNPNIYEIEYGSRLLDVITFAGGFTDKADINSVNYALLLEDQMKITIPNIEENKQSKKININTADVSMLKSLYGIGDAKANAIIDYRNNVGQFKRIEDIMNVSGIGERVFAQIKDIICI